MFNRISVRIRKWFGSKHGAKRSAKHAFILHSADPHEYLEPLPYTPPPPPPQHTSAPPPPTAPLPPPPPTHPFGCDVISMGHKHAVHTGYTAGATSPQLTGQPVVQNTAVCHHCTPAGHSQPKHTQEEEKRVQENPVWGTGVQYTRSHSCPDSVHSLCTPISSTWSLASTESSAPSTTSQDTVSALKAAAFTLLEDIKEECMKEDCAGRSEKCTVSSTSQGQQYCVTIGWRYNKSI